MGPFCRNLLDDSLVRCRALQRIPSMRRNRISNARNSSLVFDPSAIRICQKKVIENNKENNVAKVVKQDNIKVTEIRSIS